MPPAMPRRSETRDLDLVFTVPRMHRAWKDTVRTGLRRQALADLHDFLDVHRNLAAYLRALRSDVLGGKYRPQPPELTLVEKRDGVPRRLCLPSPSDAILLQTVVDVLEPAIRASQPHRNAYYAQSHAPPSVEAVDSTFSYPWWKLWPEFQSRIWRFVETYPYVVVTDLANYFDCIPLDALRNRVSSYGAFSETVLNFLFYLLDAFTWRPYYMPQSGVGLPQINFDAPRLLAHCYLFPVDEELSHLSNGDFVRWMDDINCGCPSIDAARRLLRALEIRLNSLGVRLNSGKTRVFTGVRALEHFWIDENRALTAIKSVLREAEAGSVVWRQGRDSARRRYRKFRRKERIGHWEKVCKRYLSMFSDLRDPFMVRDCAELMDNCPSLRAHICRYYRLLGPTTQRFADLESFLRSGRCLDDASLFEVVRVLAEWKGSAGSRPARSKSLAPVVAELGTEGVPNTRMTVAGVSSAIWLIAKFGTPHELAAFLRSSEDVWTRSSWASRQAAAVTPLLMIDDAKGIRTKIIESGLAEALRVIASLDQIATATQLDRQLSTYLLHPPTPEHAYPLSKVIIARVVLDGRLPRSAKRELRERLTPLVVCPQLRQLLRRRLRELSNRGHS